MCKKNFKKQINTISTEIKFFSGKQYLFLFILYFRRATDEANTVKLHLSFSKDFKVLLLSFTHLFENCLELLYSQTRNWLKDHKQKGNKKDCIFVTAVM